MRRFGWISSFDIPQAVDLRRCGWELAAGLPPVNSGAACPLIAAMSGIDANGWIELLGLEGQKLRRRIVLIGIRDALERARLLRLGFGDVLGSPVVLEELDARAERIAAHAQALPRFRELDGITLDLMARDAFSAKRPLGLHPREFALLWRLADTPGMPVGKAELMADVWHANHVPETNSVAVHISRLRAKLDVAGLAELVRTAPSGGYVLCLKKPEPFASQTEGFMLLSGEAAIGDQAVIAE